MTCNPSNSPFTSRPKSIDYAAIDALHYLGNYTRPLPVSLTRMIENAYDWEHLPFVHQSSFGAIRLVEEGRWGWRCITDLPNNGGEQAIELLVDAERHYWATTVVSGFGEGAQIHTQASAREDGGIMVDVRFYSAQKLPSKEFEQAALAGLQTQYAQLYDEDEALMLGRQHALDLQKELRSLPPQERRARVNLGPEASLDREQTHEIELERERFCVRMIDGKWTGYAAQCPHMLAPLSKAGVADGKIACMWHGYIFDLHNGEELKGRCGKLALARCEVDASGDMVVSLG